ncbi:MAG: ATP-binding cassette domain-containing protein [bacterium]|jgi:ABC-type multidrug transport system ATPase subunit
MQIELLNIAKKFNREWIFKDVNILIPNSAKLAILGANGSGKSTLLQIIVGSLSASKGEISYRVNDQLISAENIYKHFSIASPYLELVEEMTLNEMIDFHFSFKNRLNDYSNEDLLNIVGLETSRNKEIRYFSSGMKQRAKLMLAVLSNVDCIMLDEPCSNLDKQGISWYHQLLNDYLSNRTIIICSNQEYEYSICDKSLSIMDYKPDSQK